MITRTDYAVFNTRDVMLKTFDTEDAATEYANNRAAIMGGLIVAKLTQTREDLTTHDSND